MRPARHGLAAWCALALTFASAIAAKDGAPQGASSSPVTPRLLRASGANVDGRAVSERRALTVEERDLSRIQEEGRLEVERLMVEARGLSDAAALRAVQRRVIAAKLENQVRFLRARAGFARSRGDLVGAAEAETTIERLLRPPAPPAGPPQTRERATGREGARP